MLKTVNSENLSELLINFIYIFTSDPVMNSCHKFIFCDLGQVLINYFMKVHLFPSGAGIMLIISTFFSSREKSIVI